MKKNKVVLIFGPTAAGKTKLLLELFADCGEIINADSMQVYRYMDIGTAKASLEEQKRLRHHLVDIRYPDQSYNVAEFVKDANSLILSISKRQKIPVVAGGTGFYFYNLLYGLPETPPIEENIRTQVKTLAKTFSNTKLHEHLVSVDPVTAERLHPNDRYRVSRALEVFYQSGKALSEFSENTQLELPFEPIIIGLKRHRSELYDRINKRVDSMFEQGLYTEFLSLKDRGYTEQDPGMKAIGYREFYLIEEAVFSLDAVRERIKRNTRHYAKRQISFFKRIHNIQWFEPDEHELMTKTVQDFLGT